MLLCDLPLWGLSSQATVTQSPSFSVHTVSLNQIRPHSKTLTATTRLGGWVGFSMELVTEVLSIFLVHISFRTWASIGPGLEYTPRLCLYAAMVNSTPFHSLPQFGCCSSSCMDGFAFLDVLCCCCFCLNGYVFFPSQISLEIKNKDKTSSSKKQNKTHKQQQQQQKQSHLACRGCL